MRHLPAHQDAPRGIQLLRGVEAGSQRRNENERLNGGGRLAKCGAAQGIEQAQAGGGLGGLAQGQDFGGGVGESQEAGRLRSGGCGGGPAEHGHNFRPQLGIGR